MYRWAQAAVCYGLHPAPQALAQCCWWLQRRGCGGGTCEAGPLPSLGSPRCAAGRRKHAQRRAAAPSSCRQPWSQNSKSAGSRLGGVAYADGRVRTLHGRGAGFARRVMPLVGARGAGARRPANPQADAGAALATCFAGCPALYARDTQESAMQRAQHTVAIARECGASSPSFALSWGVFAKSDRTAPPRRRLAAVQQLRCFGAHALPRGARAARDTAAPRPRAVALQCTAFGAAARRALAPKAHERQDTTRQHCIEVVQGRLRWCL